MNALRSVLLVVLEPLYQVTHSWVWALLLLAIIAQAIPTLMNLLTPDRVARKTYYAELAALGRKHPDRNSQARRDGFAKLQAKHAPKRWWMRFQVILICTVLAIRFIAYGGLYQLFVHDPLPAGKPILWMPDVTRPMPWWSLILFYFAIWILYDVVRILRVDGLVDESQEPLSANRGRTIQTMAWSGVLTLLASQLPSGMAFYYVANLVGYVVVVLPIAMTLARRRKLRDAKTS